METINLIFTVIGTALLFFVLIGGIVLAFNNDPFVASISSIITVIITYAGYQWYKLFKN